MPIVLAFAVAWDDVVFVSPTAVPAAARKAISSVAMPTATSQPKKSAPHWKPPNSSRWRRRTSRRDGAGEARARSRTAGSATAPWSVGFGH